MTSESEVRACANCRFWDEVETTGRLGNWRVIGRCRRYPPSIAGPVVNESDVRHATYFPETEADEWCGEHQIDTEYPIA